MRILSLRRGEDRSLLPVPPLLPPIRIWLKTPTDLGVSAQQKGCPSAELEDGRGKGRQFGARIKD